MGFIKYDFPNKWQVFRDLAALEISRNEYKVLLALISHWCNEGTSYPTQKVLSTDTGLSNSTIKRMLNKLKEKNLIDWITGHTEWANTYIFSEDILPKIIIEKKQKTSIKTHNNLPKPKGIIKEKEIIVHNEDTLNSLPGNTEGIWDHDLLNQFNWRHVLGKDNN